MFSKVADVPSVCRSEVCEESEGVLRLMMLLESESVEREGCSETGERYVISTAIAEEGWDAGTFAGR